MEPSEVRGWLAKDSSPESQSDSSKTAAVPVHTSSESSEDTDSSSMSENHTTELVATSTDVDIRWLLPRRKNAKLHVASGTEDPGHCVCGKTLLHAEQGVGLNAAMATGAQWSPRCTAKLPTVVYQKWIAMHRDDCDEE